ncbi:hypothetical protein ACFPN1_03100 [Lysobacter yangpyeongensis]|uniref:NAD(P)-binding domain-containing protein n=1 Tax=Lysobacter yangpyeongensis TaxID=346182 RepID=A0ABW0SJ29_9GAMM
MKVTLLGATGKTGPYLINEGLKRGIELTVYGHTKHSPTLSRENLAKVMFDQIESPKYVKQAPGVSGR